MSKSAIRWFALLAILCLAIGIGGSLLVYKSTTDRRSFVNDNLCLTDTAIVNVFYTSIKKVPLAKAQADPIGYENGRATAREFMQNFADVAPCTIKVMLPPDPLK